MPPTKTSGRPISHKNSTAVKLILLLLTLPLLQSCSAIAGIFKAGMWVGVIAVIVVVAIIILIVRAISGGGK